MKKTFATAMFLIVISALLSASTPVTRASYVGFGRMDYHGMDKIFSSLKADGTVILYDEYDHTGNSKTFSDQWVSNLWDYQRGPYFWVKWDNAVSSIQVDGTVTFYEHSNYEGRQITFTSSSLPYPYIGTEWSRNPRLIKSNDAWDARIWKWTWVDGRQEICRDPENNNYVNWDSDGLVNSRANDGFGDILRDANFDQGYERAESDIADLGQFMASSLRVDGCVTLYDEPGFSGVAQDFTSDVSDLQDDSWDDRASSLKLTLGSAVSLYEDPDYGGGCKTFVAPSSQPTELTVSDKTTITLEAVVSNWGQAYGSAPGWTGAKFDVMAVENRNDPNTRILMLEMYFLRDGANLVWNPCWFRNLDVLENRRYNYLLALDCYPQQVQRTVHPGDVAKWTIDIKYFIQTACDHNWWPMTNYLDITKLEIVKIGFALEAAHVVELDNPWVEGSLQRFRLAYEAPSGGGGCPILHVFDGAEYIEQGLLDIHDIHGADVTHEQTLATAPVRVNNHYLLRLTEHPLTHSYIDQVKLLAILDDQTTRELPLISASHSEYGNVLPKLLLSDDQKTDTIGSSLNGGTSHTIDLRFIAPRNLDRLNIMGFAFQIEGNNYITKPRLR